MMRPIGKIAKATVTVGGKGGGTRTLFELTGDPDHPDFDGSNPNFNPAWDGITAGQGQWDVDSNGDGVPDSIWVDLGMPVRTMADGRMYKPLVRHPLRRSRRPDQLERPAARWRSTGERAASRRPAAR